jgi:sigma-E factor negative regulatory protein RseB
MSRRQQMIVRAAPGARRLLPALALGFACAAQAAPNDPLAWLARAAQASRQVTFEGVYVHTNGDRTSTVRISHLNNAGEEHERIEPLDGAPLDIVRRNDEMFCRFPDAKTVRLDPRVTNRFFPAILSAPAETIHASYEVKLGKTERVLGFECQWLRLEPRDGMRYPQRLCSELSTGLILRAKMLNLQDQVIEQYTFTDLRVGPQVGTRGAELKSLFKARSRQWVSDGQPRDETASGETGWMVAKPPAGFQKIAEMKRTLPGRPQPVSQIVLTDGVASLSVFVEPATGRTNESGSEDGTTSFVARPMGEQLVTVLGEVPLATAQHVARSVTRRP